MYFWNFVVKMEYMIVVKGISWILYKIYVYVCFCLYYILNGKENIIRYLREK